MKVFIGYDSREDIAYQVCKHSILSRTTSNVQVVALKQDELRKSGHYTRPEDPLSSTEFTFTRFLVPSLTGYTGWAVFVDCDFVFTDDIAKLFKLAEDNEDKAVMVVQHNYEPKDTVKMDGKAQHLYPRKNWSSMILWNCGHPSNKQITPWLVNETTGAFLHRFQWLEDHEIGNVSHEWNWLVGWHKEPKDGTPKAIHYTSGGPWFLNYMNCEYGAVWVEEKYKFLGTHVPEVPAGPFDHIPPDISDVLHKILKFRVDQTGEYYDVSEKEIIRKISMLKTNSVYAVDGGRDSKDAKGLSYDPYLESFILGCGGQITNYSKIENSMVPVVFRGITKSKHMKACEEKGRDYFYVDTGYFGNGRKKMYHRITKNAMQITGPVIDRPFDRLAETGYQARKFSRGSKILICPPSEKAMSTFGLDLDKWLTDTVDTIKKYTDRPIEIRQKPSRRERTTNDTIEMALARDVHCLVTYNSIAATEAILLGKPAFTLGPNAAESVCLSDLSQIETPYYPSLEEVARWAAHLSYCQFTEIEMKDGTAWKILNNDV